MLKNLFKNLFKSTAGSPRLRVSLDLRDSKEGLLLVQVTLENLSDHAVALVGPLATDPLPPLPLEQRIRTKIQTDGLGKRPDYQRLHQWYTPNTLHLGLVYPDEKQTAFWTRLSAHASLELKYGLKPSDIRKEHPFSKVVFHVQFSEAPDFLKTLENPEFSKAHPNGGKGLRVLMYSVPLPKVMTEVTSDDHST